MARRRSKVLTEVEFELMEIVWQQGESTVVSVREALLPTRKLAESSVRTMLRILERKGYLTHRTEKRTYIFRPLVDREEASRRMIRHLADRVSQGSANLLVKCILELEDISLEELDQIRTWIVRKEREMLR